MKYLIVAAILVATASAKSVKINGLRDCGGAGAPVRFSGSVISDPVPVPGNLVMDLTTVAGIAATKADGLMIRKVTTRSSDNTQVPCLSNGVAGTCTVNLCDTLDAGQLCSLLPADVPCSCPLEAKTYVNPEAYVTFDAEWLGENAGEGDYTTQTELVANIGAPNEMVVGCIQIDYTLVAVA